jgi:hypothetical protein
MKASRTVILSSAGLARASQTTTIKGRRAEKKRTNMKVASEQWHLVRADFNDQRTISFGVRP